MQDKGEGTTRVLSAFEVHTVDGRGSLPAVVHGAGDMHVSYPCMAHISERATCHMPRALYTAAWLAPDQNLTVSVALSYSTALRRSVLISSELRPVERPLKSWPGREI